MIKKIIFEKKNNTGIITLNNTKSLNAIDLEMVELFLLKIKEWEKDDEIKRVLLKGNGKAFCAGGDVKSVFLSSGTNDLKRNFFNKEYKLNYAISKFNKPYLSIWDGIVMGGGVGLSIYGTERIATENSKFAMPESAIGFFPDVGSSYFLSKIKNHIGVYLGLTGKVLGAEEMIYFGLATNFQENKNIETFEKNYINNGLVSKSNMLKESNSELITNINFINEIFSQDIKYIFKSLKNSNNEFAKKTYSILETRCPMSLIVTIELLSKAKNLSLKECLEMEFQLSQKIVYRDDFNNGVETVLINKKNNHLWNPKTIYDINESEVKDIFEFHTKKLGL